MKDDRKRYAVVCLERGIADGWYSENDAKEMVEYYKSDDYQASHKPEYLMLYPALLTVDKKDWFPLANGVFHTDWYMFDQDDIGVRTLQMFARGLAIRQLNDVMWDRFKEGKTKLPVKRVE